MISVLSGGVGAARLLRELSAVMDPRDITAIVNVGDDVVLHGLTICPDIDTVNYTLANLNNDIQGWGLTGESWRVMDELDALGGESWFRLGDRDLATHLYRSQRLATGATKTDVTTELSRRWGVLVNVLPVTNDTVTTCFETEVGRLSFQEYFVRHHHDVRVHAIDVVGADLATPTDEVMRALESSTRIIIAPSNPLISIEPMLRIAPIREILHDRRADVVAVSPIIAGRAVKGPADRLLRELGHEVSALGVVDYYGDLVGRWVIDDADDGLRREIARRGVEVVATTTLMSEPGNGARVARAVLA